MRKQKLYRVFAHSYFIHVYYARIILENCQLYLKKPKGVQINLKDCQRYFYERKLLTNLSKYAQTAQTLHLYTN